jgi:hypothetical protein
MRQYLTILLIAFSITAFAAKKEWVQGYWVYQDVVGSKDMKKDQLQMVESFFKDMTFDFKSNGSYKALMMGKTEEGTWTLNKEETKIILTSTKGTVSEAGLVEITADKMIINLGNGSIIMKKGISPDKGETALPKMKMSSMSATMDQIAKKWWLKSNEKPGKTAEEIEKGNALLKGSYFQYNKNGTYKVKILGIEETGTWTFGDKNTSIETTADGGKKFGTSIRSLPLSLFSPGGMKNGYLDWNKGEQTQFCPYSPFLQSGDFIPERIYSFLI